MASCRHAGGIACSSAIFNRALAEATNSSDEAHAFICLSCASESPMHPRRSSHRFASRGGIDQKSLCLLDRDPSVDAERVDFLATKSTGTIVLVAIGSPRTA